MSITSLTAPELSATSHGFFTREGGGSSGLYQGLNCGFGSQDDPRRVRENRAHAARHLGVDPDMLLGCHQVHSNKAVIVTQDSLFDMRDSEKERPKADALVSDVSGVALSVLTADCQSVLFADMSAGVIGAAHAGWKGALLGVLDHTLDAMVSLGAQKKQVRAVIGPCISQKNYEVGEEFFENFFDYDAQYARFFTRVPQRGKGKYLFDLPGFGLHRLRTAGVEHAQWVQACTYEDEQRFFSYRRSTHLNEADYGRLISAIALV